MAKNDEEKEFLPGYRSVQEFTTDGFKRVVTGVKAFQALPQPGPSWDLQKSYPQFSKSMKNARSKIIPMMASLLKHVNIPTSDFRSRDIDEKFEFLVECNDDLLERIGSSLDEADGLFTKSEMIVVDKGLAATALRAPGSWGKRKLNAINAEMNEAQSKSQSQDISNRQIKKPLFRLRVTEKPQLKFAKPIDNSTAPFVPKLKEKPHSIKPLSILPEYNSKNEEFYGHPYLVELNKWVPRDDMLTKVDPQVPKCLKDTPVVYISTPRDLERMMYDLLDKKEIGVDLEHHSYRTYFGLTCLIQISSREKDYVIDGLALREELTHLNEIFADPKVIKIFHGSSNDMDWLQRDFGLYVVNMFDTYVASKVLGHPQHSLQYLLGKYCEVSQNKSMQLADWRLRPLPNEMLEYARQDTHYLIYIYERMRNDLIDAGNQHNNLLLSVYDQSRLMCLKRYEKPVSNAQLALRKTRRSLNNRQLYAFTEIYKWRDDIAREKDESLGYVLPNHMLLTIAESLPKEMNGILACCDPVPQLLTSNLAKIHKIITTARELPLNQQSAQKDKAEKKVKLKNWVVVVNSIHDLAPVDESESSKAKIFEDEEDLSDKPREVKDSWPQQWSDPGGWKSLIQKKPSTWKFSSMGKVSMSQEAKKSYLSSNTFGPMDAESLSTPYGRFLASKKIVDMLKDPATQKNMDLEDPLVKAVYDAVTVVDESEMIVEKEEEPARELYKVLDEGEFIPFNPLAPQPSTKRKRRGKKVKREKLDDSVKLEEKEDDEEYNAAILAEPQEDGEIASPDNSPILKNTRDKGKKKKSNFLNRLKKKMWSKNSKPENSSAESPDIIEIDNDQEDHPDTGTVKKSKKHSKVESLTSQQDHHPSPPTKRARRGEFQNHQRQQSFDRQKKSPIQHQNSRRGRGDRQKNKFGIFKAFKSDNKSITFK